MNFFFVGKIQIRSYRALIPRTHGIIQFLIEHSKKMIYKFDTRNYISRLYPFVNTRWVGYIEEGVRIYFGRTYSPQSKIFGYALAQVDVKNTLYSVYPHCSKYLLFRTLVERIFSNVSVQITF